MGEFDDLFGESSSEDRKENKKSEKDDLFNELSDEWNGAVDDEEYALSDEEAAQLIEAESEKKEEEESPAVEKTPEVKAEEIVVPDSGGGEFEELSREYIKAKADYYRHVLRDEDKKSLDRIMRIPDDWDSFDKEPPGGIEISDSQRRRLSDIKSVKSWELKFESLNIYYITTLEKVLMSCFTHSHVPADELEEANDSIRNLFKEIELNEDGYKHLFLSLAKRAASDFYYLIHDLYKFYRKKDFSFGWDLDYIRGICVNMIDIYGKFHENLPGFREERVVLDRFFKKSPTASGWKMNEFALKKYFEEIEDLDVAYIERLTDYVKKAFLFKKKLKIDFDFLRYYFNGKDGKLFRYSFIFETFAQKMEEGRITEEVFQRFKDIRDTFTLMKDYLEGMGLKRFGPRGFTYRDTIEFVFKGGKVVEYYLLRIGDYEQLKNLRSDIFDNIEVEMVKLAGHSTDKRK
ncbi:MAG: hypothetical protein GY754_05950 [bacterium]|nr:hypothetical protein [bacterium]